MLIQLLPGLAVLDGKIEKGLADMKLLVESAAKLSATGGLRGNVCSFVALSFSQRSTQIHKVQSAG